MSATRNFTKPNLLKRQRFFDDIEALNKFSKVNVHQMTDEQLEKFIEDYSHLLIRESTTVPFQDFAHIHARYVKMMESKLEYQKVKSSLATVQSTLLEEISKVRHSLEKVVPSQLLSFSGIVTITFDSKANQYVEVYIPDGFSSDGRIDTEMECRLISVKYFEVLAYLCQELPPDRFKVCEKCGTPFFQATAKLKRFCSSNCSKAVAQAQYIERKNKGGE